MTAPDPEKAAPIPAEDAVNTVAGILALNYGREYVTGRDLEVAEEIVAALADREARPSLPDSREERIREDEREACIELASQYCWTRYKDRPPAHLREPAVFTSHEWHKIADAMRAERQKADRARQGGNNG